MPWVTPERLRFPSAYHVRMSVDGSQFDYPVVIDPMHRVSESADYSGDRFDCAATEAYMHTGAWPTWGYCPFCGGALE